MFIGIDIGTTGCKGILTDADFNILGEEYFEVPLIKLSPCEIEQSAEDWWRLTQQVIRNLVKGCVRPVRAISVSSQGISFVPVDKDNNPLYNSLNWLDTRATDQVASIKNIISEADLYRITGKTLSASYTLPKLLWFREHKRELYDKTEKFLMPLDYITAKLCGRCITDKTMASGTMLFDNDKGEWSQTLMDLFAIDKNKLPEVGLSGQPAGVILKSVAAELGLNEDVVIAVGAQDQKCAALAAGIGKGIATVSIGTATAVEVLSDKIPSFESALPRFCFVNEHEFVLENAINTTGAALKWFKDNFYPELDYESIDRILSIKESDGHVFFYPFLCESGCFYGLNLSSDRDSLLAGVLEGVCFQVRGLIEKIEAESGPITTLHLYGGGAKSRVWMQMMADITGKAVCIPHTEEMANVGAAMLAGRAVQSMQSFPQDATPKMKAIYNPKSSYETLYAEYTRIEQRLYDKP